MTIDSNQWQGRRVLVTGAGGFIGSHLVERLVAAGADVRALVHYRSSGSREWLNASQPDREVEFIAGDVRDVESVKRAIDGIDTVFHLAALIGIPYSYLAARSYVDVNIGGTLNVLQVARDTGVRRIIHTSTSEVYGTARQVPISETHPLQTQSPYAASKLSADKLAEAFHASFGVPVVTVRPFNTYGPRQSARAVIPTIVTQVFRGEGVRLGHLSPTRDFTFVTDMVSGFLSAAHADAAVGHVINLGTGREISIGDLAALVMKLMGRSVPIMSDAGRERPSSSEVERLCADASQAKALLGWQPTLTLEEGLTRTVTWIERNLDRFRIEYGI